MEENGGIFDISANDITIDRNTIPDLKVGDYIEIKVADTGIGIFPENTQNIFGPYFTTKPVGEGTGMGLAVVHGIVESHGGKIAVESTIGQGTTFSIYLPITKNEKSIYTRKNIHLVALKTSCLSMMKPPLQKGEGKFLSSLDIQ